MDYGVQPGEPLGFLRSVNELADSEVIQVCGPSKAGCVCGAPWIKGTCHNDYSDGVWLYYRTGDECTLRHELQHVMNGTHHTVEYFQRVIAGLPPPCG